MPKFFEDAFSEKAPYLKGEHANHIGRSLRMRAGEPLTVCACGIDYECVISEITADTVYLDILSSAPCCAEPTIHVTLYQALPKADKFEQIIQKAVELGVTEVVPMLTARCISRLSAKDFEKKRVRLQNIALNAAQQSGRGIIPQIAPLHNLEEAAKSAAKLDYSLVCYESEGGISFSAVPQNKTNYGIFIGSEGGFDESEIVLLRQHGVTPVWLGKRILRCETAPLTALSVLMFHTGNLN